MTPNLRGAVPRTSAEAPPSPVVVVLRYRVTGTAPRTFAATVQGLVSRSHRPDGGAEGRPREPSLTVLQPVLGHEPDVWEVRVGLPSMAAFGDAVDRGEGWFVSLQDPGRWSGVEGVEVVDVETPVWRVVLTDAAHGSDAVPG